MLETSDGVHFNLPRCYGSTRKSNRKRSEVAPLGTQTRAGELNKWLSQIASYNLRGGSADTILVYPNIGAEPAQHARQGIVRTAIWRRGVKIPTLIRSPISIRELRLDVE